MAPAICRNEDPTATTLWLIPGRHKATAALTRPAALQVQKEALAAKIQTLAAAEQAHQQLEQQLAAAGGHTRELQDALAEADALRQELQDAQHRCNTAKQARERALSEVSAGSLALAGMLHLKHGRAGRAPLYLDGPLTNMQRPWACNHACCFLT